MNSPGASDEFRRTASRTVSAVLDRVGSVHHLGHGQQLIAPYRESGHALRMRALAASGNNAEALLAFDRLRQLLRDDLGVDPSPDLRALHQELLGRTSGR